MAVYLGNAGLVQLQRSGNGAFHTELNPGDVDASAKRFSLDFPSGTFVTGDRITLRRLEANGAASTQVLDFVSPSGWEDGQQHPDGAWFVNVDAVGGVKLYQSRILALRGNAADAVTLQAPSGSYRALVSVAGGTTARCLGEVLTYELTTEREAIDVTSIGDAFRQQVSGLISGGGSVECFWDWHLAACNERGLDDEVELAQYMHQLVLRQQLGSRFRGIFFLKSPGAEPITEDLDGVSAKAALFYSADCLVTNVGMAFEPDQAVRSKLDFVTTGEIKLLYTVPDDHLLQEDGYKIKNETDDGRILLEV